MYLHDELQFLFFYQWLSDCFTSLKLCKWKTKAVDIRARTLGKKSRFSEAILSPISSLAWQEFSFFLCWWWKSGKDKQAMTRCAYAKKLLKTICICTISWHRYLVWVEFVAGFLPFQRSYSLGTPVFPSPLNPTNSSLIWNTCLTKFLRTLKCLVGKQITVYND